MTSYTYPLQSQAQPELLTGDYASIAIVVSREHVETNQKLLDNVLHQLTILDATPNPEDIFSITSIREMPLLVQTLSETLQYDAIIVLDLSITKNTLSASASVRLNAVFDALYHIELENGITVSQGIFHEVDHTQDIDVFIEEKSTKIAHNAIETANLVSIIRAMSLENENIHDNEL